MYVELTKMIVIRWTGKCDLTHCSLKSNPNDKQKLAPIFVLRSSHQAWTRSFLLENILQLGPTHGDSTKMSILPQSLQAQRITWLWCRTRAFLRAVNMRLTYVGVTQSVNSNLHQGKMKNGCVSQRTLHIKEPRLEDYQTPGQPVFNSSIKT